MRNSDERAFAIGFLVGSGVVTALLLVILLGAQ